MLVPTEDLLVQNLYRSFEAWDASPVDSSFLFFFTPVKKLWNEGYSSASSERLLALSLLSFDASPDMMEAVLS